MNASARIVVSEVFEEAVVKKTKTFDRLDFRKALGSFPTGVTIISARTAEGRLVGVTCSSFNSVSLDPPLILWSLAKNSYSRAAFETTPNWAVNLLSSDQETLSNQFAKAGNDKFASVETEAGIAGVPLLKGCCARFQCATEFIYEGGDHIIVVGRVLAFDRSDRLPLVFHSGQYNRQIADAIARALGMRTRHLLDWA
jgi:3-hydroxy-9,10-secoandrosta-1,3,5(10)-triene-9,17-dione monooxygenase reductase component